MKERINVKLQKIDEKNAPFPNKAVTRRSKNNKIYTRRGKRSIIAPYFRSYY